VGYDAYMNKREKFFEQSHGPFTDFGQCLRCKAEAGFHLRFCMGVVSDADLEPEEREIVEKEGVECEECHYIYHRDEMLLNGEYELCGNCDTRPGASEMEPMTRDWLWAVVNDALPRQEKS
jgi:hypothetical protein